VGSVKNFEKEGINLLKKNIKKKKKKRDELIEQLKDIEKEFEGEKEY